jgi:hypothetical protein
MDRCSLNARDKCWSESREGGGATGETLASVVIEVIPTDETEDVLGDDADRTCTGGG